VIRITWIVAVLAGALALTVAPSSAAPPASGTPRVVKAQRQLNALGCQAGAPSGVLSRHTRSAIIRFQSRVGIRQTGHLDVRTRPRLYADHPPRCDRRPVPGRSGHGRRIVVSQKQNWVWLVAKRGGIVAQGGMVDNPRVLHKGTHRVASYCGRAARIRLNSSLSGSLWLDNFVRFAPCGIGFHRIPRHKAGGHQIHPDWILGTNLSRSHGCLRLSHTLARQVWSFATVGTPVRVV
jgi:hypothetical protein